MFRTFKKRAQTDEFCKKSLQLKETISTNELKTSSSSMVPDIVKISKIGSSNIFLLLDKNNKNVTSLDLKSHIIKEVFKLLTAVIIKQFLIMKFHSFKK